MTKKTKSQKDKTKSHKWRRERPRYGFFLSTSNTMILNTTILLGTFSTLYKDYLLAKPKTPPTHPTSLHTCIPKKKKKLKLKLKLTVEYHKLFLHSSRTYHNLSSFSSSFDSRFQIPASGHLLESLFSLLSFLSSFPFSFLFKVSQYRIVSYPIVSSSHLRRYIFPASGPRPQAPTLSRPS